MKAHLKDVQEPLTEGQDFTANCGVVVPRAKFAFVWDARNFGVSTTVSTVNFCRKCYMSSGLLLGMPRYVYGLVPGEEAKQAEREKETAIA